MNLKCAIIACILNKMSPNRPSKFGNSLSNYQIRVYEQLTEINFIPIDLFLASNMLKVTCQKYVLKFMQHEIETSCSFIYTSLYVRKYKNVNAISF